MSHSSFRGRSASGFTLVKPRSSDKGPSQSELSTLVLFQVVGCMFISTAALSLALAMLLWV